MEGKHYTRFTISNHVNDMCRGFCLTRDSLNIFSMSTYLGDMSPLTHTAYKFLVDKIVDSSHLELL